MEGKQRESFRFLSPWLEARPAFHLPYAGQSTIFNDSDIPTTPFSLAQKGAAGFVAAAPGTVFQDF